MIGPVLKGKRVTLRPARGTDAHRLFRWRNDASVTPFVMSGSKTVDEERRRIKRSRTFSDRLLYIIETKSGKAIGTIGFGDLGDGNKRAALGIMIGESSEQGKGYGRDAMELLIDHAFRTLGIHKIWLEVFDFNMRARRLYLDLGFKKEGVLREHVFKNGVFVNQWRMGLLDREWKARRKARTL
jgi:RimJ/RimL family protein N-acetyltransferase